MNEKQDFESNFDSLDEDLKYAKEHPFKVVLDFDTRFRVWRDQILNDRLLMLNKTKLIRDATRYYDLSIRDYSRLFKRAVKELLIIADNPMIPKMVLATEQHIYQDRKTRLQTTFSKFADELLNIELRG